VRSYDRKDDRYLVSIRVSLQHTRQHEVRLKSDNGTSWEQERDWLNATPPKRNLSHMGTSVARAETGHDANKIITII
jgi:hypothetical protein